MDAGLNEYVFTVPATLALLVAFAGSVMAISYVVAKLSQLFPKLVVCVHVSFTDRSLMGVVEPVVVPTAEKPAVTLVQCTSLQVVTLRVLVALL